VSRLGRAAALGACLIALSGCASFNQRCLYNDDGTLQYIRTRSTVVGTGETELVSTKCGDVGYSTRDTGLSDNGVEALAIAGKAGTAVGTGGASLLLDRD
jgi:hypothetical protein